jgi:GDP-L-fucose synthase
MLGQPYDLRGKRVWVAGHRGMAGSALVRRLAREDCEVLTATHQELDLRDAAALNAWMGANKPQAVFMAAAKVGGIHANDSYPADFIYDNLAIAANVTEASFRHGVEKMLALGSTCIYPRLSPQPIPESALLTGPLEKTNQWYAIAKIAGIKLAQAYRIQHGCDFISAMPTNLYGPGDNFHPENSHVLPGLIRRAHERKRAGETGLTIWGSGKPRREFLHIDDAADGLVAIMQRYSEDEHINLGCGEDIPVGEVARLVMEVVGLPGEITHDASKPDGTPRKLVDVSKLETLGWRAKIPLRAGLEETYSWYLQHVA